MEKEITNEQYLDSIHRIIKVAWGDAVKVNIFCNAEGIQIEPEYKTNISGYSMMTINGNWVSNTNR
jgi:hypothetical protein